MKKLIQKWWLLLYAAVFSFTLIGCGDITTGNEKLDQAIVDMVVDGVNNLIENTTVVEDSEEIPVITAIVDPTEKPEPTATKAPTSTPKPTATPKPTNTPKPTTTPTPKPVIDEDGWYYSKKDVALYIHTYGKLPENFITKAEAQDLGWTGGSVENYKEGAAIGGDKFGNREGILPKKNGRQYYECDIDTKGRGSRGTRRIVFSNDGLIYYTDDHYESFTLLYGKE